MNSNQDDICIISKSKAELAKIKRKEYLIANKDKISLQKKLRHQVNAADLKRRNAEYYRKNKQHVHNKFTSKCDCDCGSTVSLGYLKRHRYTKTHFVNLWNLFSSGQISFEQYQSFYEKSKYVKKQIFIA
jgi:hypothetical protein